MPFSKPNTITNENGDLLIRFRCTSCNFEEFIPQDVVAFFDVFDDGDSSVPPKFDCTSCYDGKAQPVYYTGHNGITYSL